MSQFNHVLREIENISPLFETEKISIQYAANRILQEDIIADTPMPPFNKSAVDGYACRMEDIDKPLKLKEIIPAGKAPTAPINQGECAKIMTGAPIPQGADCVFMIEDAQIIDENIIKCTNPQTKRNICYQGEDFREGEILIEKGTIIKPAHIAVMASVGYTQITVSKNPSVGLITTGSELVEPQENISGGKIRNSNAYQLITQLHQIGLNPNYYGIVKDDFNTLTETLEKIIAQNDIIIITGGASVGEFDFIPRILKHLNFQIIWERTGLKPGNPMSFAIREKKIFLGLSGNPVSSFVQFELLGKPILYKILGAKYSPLKIKAISGSDIKVKKNGRHQIKPVLIDSQGIVTPIPFNGSADIKALSEANALLEIPENSTNIKKGDIVYVRPL